MNFLQKLGLFILIIISVIYVYFSYFNKDFKLPEFKDEQAETTVFNPLENNKEISSKKEPAEKQVSKIIKIFLLNNSGELAPVNRNCQTTNGSCFKYAVEELIKAPSKIEKTKGFTSEIPQSTKILSIRESSNAIQIDLSSDFETGGGAESTYMRVKQIIKTANANTKTPVYLYINGKQANVIGGEGIMIRQPLSEKSFEE